MTEQRAADAASRAGSAKAAALAVLHRHGYSAGDLDFLLYEGQSGTPGDDDLELEAAIGVLGSLRQAERITANS